ncbi:MAG: hypothetical protein FWD11_01765 [Micrococcales bacterium]|nr:hypothetical protein [Micrococcales bacterium]
MTRTQATIAVTVAVAVAVAALSGCGITVNNDSGPQGSVAPSADTGPGPSGSPADDPANDPASTSDHDHCVVGTWTVPPPNGWDMITFAPDGSYEAHYRASTATITITEAGQWVTSGADLTAFKASYWVNDQEVSGDDLASDLGYGYMQDSSSSRYTCDEHSLTIIDQRSGGTVRWTR